MVLTVNHISCLIYNDLIMMINNGIILYNVYNSGMSWVVEDFDQFSDLSYLLSKSLL